MIHETGCIHCGKKKFDSVKGSDLCFKHYRQYNARITKRCKDDGLFKKRYQLKDGHSRVKSSWNSIELAYYMLKNKDYCSMLRDRTLQKLAL